MGLLDNLEPPSQKKTCPFGKILESLDATDQSKLVEALANDKWSSLALTNALKERGIVTNRHSLHDHRTRVCLCWRT
jgi:hypothetical protein